MQPTEPRRRTARRGLATALTLLVPALLSACGSPAATPTPAPSPTGSLPPAGCTSLSAVEKPAGSYTGHTVVRFVVHNDGTAPCVMNGYFNVVLQDASGATVSKEQQGGGQASSATPAPVTVAPGDTAEFLLEAVDFSSDGSPCPAANVAALTAPGAPASFTVQLFAPLSPCGGSFTVGAVTPPQ